MARKFGEGLAVAPAQHGGYIVWRPDMSYMYPNHQPGPLPAFAGELSECLEFIREQLSSPAAAS